LASLTNGIDLPMLFDPANAQRTRIASYERSRPGSVQRMALFLDAIAVAHYGAGRYAEALRHTEELLRSRPGFRGATAALRKPGPDRAHR
jgi:hypothetical protein